MGYIAESIHCPNCGAPQSPECKKCEYCGCAVIVTSFDVVRGMSLPVLNKYAASYRNQLKDNPGEASLGISLGLCYLKLKLYDNAIAAFSKALESVFDDPDLYFYMAIAELRGKIPFLAPRKAIDEAESYINAAISIEPKAVYYLLWAYIRYDHHARKQYVMHPDYRELLAAAKSCGLGSGDTDMLFGILGTPVPDAIK